MKRAFFKTLGGSLILCVISFSCASTPKTESIASGDATISNQAESERPLPAPPTASELYAKKSSESKISLLSSPKETTKGKIFTSPFVVKAENSDGKPLESFEISVLYPSSRKNGDILFSETMITTDSSGKAEFLPPLPEFSFNSEISFYPKADFSATVGENADSEENSSEKSKIEEIQKSVALKAPFKVQTNQKAAGGVIAVVDFNQNEKPVLSNPVSCQNILMALMKLGFIKIGNAPQEAMNAVIQGDEKKIHSRAKSIAPSFIIFGTVRIDSTEKTDSGFSYTLSADVKSMDSKTGEITFKTQKTVTVTDKNDWNALANARKTLADEIAGEIKYGI